MNKSEALAILANSKNVRFVDAVKVATAYFGAPRIKGSHHIFKMPWPGDPMVNLQPDGNKAKDYQVKQLVKAIKKMEDEREKTKTKTE